MVGAQCQPMPGASASRHQHIFWLLRNDTLMLSLMDDAGHGWHCCMCMSCVQCGLGRTLTSCSKRQASQAAPLHARLHSMCLAHSLSMTSFKGGGQVETGAVPQLL